VWLLGADVVTTSCLVLVRGKMLGAHVVTQVLIWVLMLLHTGQLLIADVVTHHLVLQLLPHQAVAGC